MYFSSQSSGCYHSTPTKNSKPRISKSMSSDGNHPKYFVRLNSLEGETVQTRKPEKEVQPRTGYKDRPYLRRFGHSTRVHSLPSPNLMFQAFHSPFGGSSAGHIAHMPFNLTKGQYECWTSVPHYPTEEMVGGCQSDAQFAPQTLSAQLTKTFTSLVGGVCDLVTGTLDPSYMWNSSFNCDKKSSETPTSSKSFSSNLNPNAKCFTPLNPLAREFHPSSPPPSIFLPDTLCEAMAASLRVPPNGQSEQKSSSSAEGSQTSCSEDESPAKNRVDGFGDETGAEEDAAGSFKAVPNSNVLAESSEDDTTLDSTNCFDDSGDLETEDDGDDDISSGDECLFRTLSGSSEDGFITFGSPSQAGSSSQTCCDISNFVRNSKDSMQNDLLSTVSQSATYRKNILEESEESSDDDEDAVDDSDSDWDEVDHSNDKFDEETLAMFADPIMSFGSSYKKDESLHLKISPDHPEEPQPQAASKEDVCEMLANANATWNKNYHGVKEKDACKKTSVSIAPKESFIIIYEDPELSEALIEARKSDFPRRQADKQRMEMLMAPVFAPEHRERVWRRLYGDKAE